MVAYLSIYIFVNFCYAYLIAYSSAYLGMFLPCLSAHKSSSQACSLLNIWLVAEIVVIMCCPCGIFVMSMLIFLLIAYLVL